MAAVDVYIISVGSSGSDLGSVVQVQSKAASDRARDGAGDEIHQGSESPSRKKAAYSKGLRRSQRHPETGLESDMPMRLLRQGLGAQT